MTASAPSHLPRQRRMAHVSVSTSASAVLADWEALLAEAPASAYQTPAWLLPWLATLGRDAAPLFVLASDAQGPVALLALGRSRWCGVVAARFLGMPDSNFGLGLFHPGVDWTPDVLRRLLAEAGRLGRFDLAWLANQPFALGGCENPLARLPHWTSPSLQHETPLDGLQDPALGRILSAKARKHIRQKEAKLAALGPVRHAVAEDDAMAARIATALLAQRAARFGATARDAAVCAFLQAAARPGSRARPGLQLHALLCGDTIVSAFAGASHGGRTSGMMVSHRSEPEWARFSPGELLVARAMAAASHAGAQRFDLGIGEARYKNSFCPIAVPLFDIVLGLSWRGRLAARTVAAAIMAKRRIKQNPQLWRAILRWRAQLRRS